MRRIVSLALLGAGLASVVPASASAQERIAMLSIEGDFAAPLNAPARDRFQPGGGGSVAALLAAFPFALPTFRARAIVLGDGPAPPPDTGFLDPGVGTLYTLTGGLRLRTDGIGQTLPEPEATGLWIEIDIGAALTGSIARPTFEASVGFLWDAGGTEGAGHLDIGPFARFVHVLQTDEKGIDANSTYLITAGIEVVLFDAAPTLVEEQRVIRTREAPHHRRIEGNDADQDGIDDSDDACRDEPEDLDGVRDIDGCPDPDDDADGIPDVSDECPRDAEDVDQYLDADGCPEEDNDGDSIADRFDACPNEAETENGVEDADGCPEPGAEPPPPGPEALAPPTSEAPPPPAADAPPAAPTEIAP